MYEHITKNVSIIESKVPIYHWVFELLILVGIKQITVLKTTKKNEDVKVHDASV